MPLSDTQIRKAPAREKTYKLTDERGLYLEITPSGSKWWRFKYRFQDKEKRLSLGVYPDVDLKSARRRRDEARSLIANNVDPSEQRKAQKATQFVEAANSFEAIAREWHAQRKGVLEKNTLDGIMMRMQKHLFPWLGPRPIAKIEAPALLEVLRRAEAQALGETPRRLRQYCDKYVRGYDEDLSAEPSFPGKLANDIPGHGGTMGLSVIARFGAPGKRPNYYLEASSPHALARDQQEGIDAARHHAILEAVGHFERSAA